MRILISGRQVWLSCIKRQLQLLQLVPQAEQIFLTNLIDRIRLEISNQIQRKTTRSMLEHMDMMSQLGMVTAEMLTAMSIPDIAEILARHLPRVGIENILVARLR